ncbi:MAG: serine hydrolase domain-containing protein [Desulfonatronovibrio sp.]
MFLDNYTFKSAVISIFFFMAAILLFSCGGGSSDNDEETYLSYSMVSEMGREALEADPNAGLSIALLSDGDILWTQEFGYADQIIQTPVTRETIFGIGSVSKVFTAAAVMKLVDQGLVNLDDPLTAYLPDFEMLSPEYKDITVRMLLNHSSGLPGSNYRGGLTDRPWPEYQDTAYQSIKQSRLKHLPGYMNVYCNDGFTLSELLVQAVTGLPFTQFVKEEIFRPLEMTTSRFSTDPFPEGLLAKAYLEGTDLPMENLNFYGAGGVYSTPEELVRFLAMIANRGILNETRLLTESSLDAMEENQTSGKFRVVDTDYLAFGLGWDNVSHPAANYVGQKALTKDGGTMVYRSEIWVIPEQNIGVAVVAVNAQKADLAGMAEKACLGALVDKGVLDALPDPIAHPETPPVDPSDNLLESITGYYASYQTLFRVSVQPDRQIQIDTRVEDGWSPEMKNLGYQENGWFSSEDIPGLELKFKTEQGRQYLIIREWKDYFDVELPLAQRLQDGSPFSSAWTDRLDKTWLKANDPAFSYLHYFEISPEQKLIAENDLPGNLFVGEADEYLPVITNQGDNLARMDLLIPIANGRDMSDLEIISRDGEEWLRCSGFLYRPLETVPGVQYGSYRQVTVQEEYLTEWVRLEPAGIEANMVFNGPENARWIVWDADFNQAGRGWGPASIVLDDQNSPYYVALYAKPGQTLNLAWE